MKFFETLLIITCAAANTFQEGFLKEPRQMRATFTTKSGKNCLLNCMDQGQFFCVSADHQNGSCCDTKDESCRPPGGICSFDIAQNWFTMT